MLTANTKANTPIVRSPLLQLNQFMISPFRVRQSERRWSFS